jgi:hypothetical protein
VVVVVVLMVVGVVGARLALLLLLPLPPLLLLLLQGGGARVRPRGRLLRNHSLLLLHHHPIRVLHRTGGRVVVGDPPHHHRPPLGTRGRGGEEGTGGPLLLLELVPDGMQWGLRLGLLLLPLLLLLVLLLLEEGRGVVGGEEAEAGRGAWPACSMGWRRCSRARAESGQRAVHCAHQGVGGSPGAVHRAGVGPHELVHAA